MLKIHDKLADKQGGVKHNTHHILFPRRAYDVGWSKRLREFPWLKVELREDEHNSLHKQVERVPLPATKRMKEAVLVLEGLAEKGALDRDASIITRIDVLLCIWSGYTDTAPTCNALRAQKKVIERYYELRLP